MFRVRRSGQEPLEFERAAHGTTGRVRPIRPRSSASGRKLAGEIQFRLGMLPANQGFEPLIRPFSRFILGWKENGFRLWN